MIRKLTLIVMLLAAMPLPAADVVGRVVDADKGHNLPARIYVQNEAGRWLFVDSAEKAGSALAYREQWVPMANSVEKHTTISAHPFRIELPKGKYRITIVRGKEYFPLTASLIVRDDRKLAQTFRLKRWINMASRGWYSGETHVHRRIHELSNVMLAEDLNVAFPVTFWTINAFEVPNLSPSPLRRQGPSPFGRRKDVGNAPIKVDSTHVILPRNTEYEVFSVKKKRHVLGAVFVLNHKTKFREGMPPVAKLAEQAHREGALLDLDKHNWPWSMMLVPVAKVDLYELSNNSVWRTRFGFRRSMIPPAKYMKVEQFKGNMTEWGWLNFGFENYYTLLNCGFPIQPTAGTASGVHPVPLGFSRVYVHVPKRFSHQQWIAGLRQGRSFVTTGPMLFAKLNGKYSGHTFNKRDGTGTFQMNVLSESDRSVDRIEVVVNGRVVRTVKANQQNTRRLESGSYRTIVNVELPISESSWVAVRSFQLRADGRIRFAHTAPWHVRVADQPVRPRRAEVQYLIGRIENEIKRNQDVLPKAALAEYQQALAIYRRILKRAK